MSKANPLPLSDTLRDLALLRATDFDISSILPRPTALPEETTPLNEVDESVQRSYVFAKEARTVLKLQNRGEVEKQGARVEEVRSKLEDVVHGLQGC